MAWVAEAFQYQAGLETHLVDLGRSTDPRLQLLLRSGGDDRIWPDPVSGRNRYGTTIPPAPDEIWFSSSTATTIGQEAYRQIDVVLRSLFEEGGEAKYLLEDWFDNIRSELLKYFGCERSEAVLAPSGTDAELIALAIAKSVIGRPITNVVIAPGETGSGVTKAAAGLNFSSMSSLGGPTHVGRRLIGWETADIEIECVEIRDPDGSLRHPCSVDSEVVNAVENALKRNRGVLVHLLDTSKTGHSGLSRATAMQLARSAPEQILVVVDACQLRCSPDQIRADLKAGFVVLITGSKFAGGPPFSGALLLPEAISTLMHQAPAGPHGLANHSAQFDWPNRLRATFAAHLDTTANFGLGLRWTAALVELSRLSRIDRDERSAIVRHFASEVGARAAALPMLTSLMECEEGANGSIVSLAIGNHKRGFVPFTAVAKIHADLRTAIDGSACLERIVHVGQPVQIGHKTVLRVCASAAHVHLVSDRLMAGATLVDAFSPVARDLDVVFEKLATLIDGYGHNGHA